MNYTDFSEDERKFYLSESGFDSREKEFFRLRVYEEKTLFEAAYGLAITITMLMTTILLYQHLRYNKNQIIISKLIISIFLIIESCFLYANLFKFINGGYITILIAGALVFLMYIWIYGSVIKRRFNEYVDIESYSDKFKDIQQDKEIPLYATNIVYLTQTPNYRKIERKIMFSIFNKQPKRAKYYWFINVRVTDEPYTTNYTVKTIVPNEAFTIQFDLGFRIDQRINVFLSQVIQDLVSSGELRFSQKKYMINSNDKYVVGDFKFVLLEEILSNESVLSKWDSFILSTKLLIKKITVSPSKWFGIDTSNVQVEKVPIIIGHKEEPKLIRVN